MLGSKSGAPVAEAWAMLMFHGSEGYLELTRQTMESVDKLKSGIRAIDGLYVVGDPDMSVFSFSSHKNDIYRIGDELKTKGWHIDQIMHPEALHLIVTMPNLKNTGQFIADLETSVRSVRRRLYKRLISDVGIRTGKKLLTAFPLKGASILGVKSSASLRTSHNKSSASFYGIAAEIDDNTILDEIVLNYLEGVYSSR